jgi:hypothetical protein
VVGSPQYRSLGVACAVQLAEHIERSRVADRILRAPPPPPSVDASAGQAAQPAQPDGSNSADDQRSLSAGLVDRSISALAATCFSIMHN